MSNINKKKIIRGERRLVMENLKNTTPNHNNPK